MQTVIRKSVPKYMRNQLDQIKHESLSFMRENYHPFFDHSPLRTIFTTGANKSAFYNNDHQDEVPTCVVGLRPDGEFFLYNKKTAHLTTPKGGLRLPWHIVAKTSFIHELTHFVQFKEGRKASEVETTVNEILYLLENHPEYFKKLVSTNGVTDEEARYNFMEKYSIC